MQVSGNYDLVVIGDQLSGLFLAAGAAEMGFKVLVLEQRSVPSVSFEAPSGRFLGDFLAEPFLGLEPGSPFDAFLRGLGLYQNIDDLFPFHQPALQIVSEKKGAKHRLTMHYEEKALAAAVDRDFPPADREGYRRLLSGAVMEKGSFGAAVEAAGLPVEAEEFGWMQSVIYGALADPKLRYASYKEILSMARKGVRYPLGGRSALKERLQARVQVFGGTIKRATKVEEIVFERGRLAGVLLSSYEGFVRSPLVVGAMGARTLLQMVPEKFRPSGLQNALKKVQPRFWRLSFTMLVPEASIPEGMGSHLVLRGEGNDQMLQLQIFPKDSYGGIPAGHRAVVGRVLVPFVPESLGEKAVGRELKRALRRVESVIPFLNERPFVMSPDPEKLGTDPAYLRYFKFKDLDFIPPSYLVFDQALEEGPTATRYLDWSRFGLKGLALCSRDIHPLLGGTGEIMVAMDLLDILKKHRERK